MFSGWWLGHPSEKYEFVNWDDDIPNRWGNKIDVPNHQPVMDFMGFHGVSWVFRMVSMGSQGD